MVLTLLPYAVRILPRGRAVLSSVVASARHAHPAGADTGLLGELFPSVRDGMLERTSQTAASLVIEPAEVQRASLATVGALFAQVITTDEMVGRLTQATAATA